VKCNNCERNGKETIVIYFKLYFWLSVETIHEQSTDIGHNRRHTAGIRKEIFRIQVCQIEVVWFRRLNDSQLFCLFAVVMNKLFKSKHKVDAMN